MAGGLCGVGRAYKVRVRVRVSGQCGGGMQGRGCAWQGGHAWLGGGQV